MCTSCVTSQVRITGYSFLHGHCRSSYYRMRNWRTLTAAERDAPAFQPLHTRCVV